MHDFSAMLYFALSNSSLGRQTIHTKEFKINDREGGGLHPALRPVFDIFGGGIGGL